MLNKWEKHMLEIRIKELEKVLETLKDILNGEVR